MNRKQALGEIWSLITRMDDEELAKFSGFLKAKINAADAPWK